ncbi:MAG: hypothetical protein LBP54_04775 [Campylobacteraceae bacterium]|jgi:hypothetical protein|nr:hypothetical protein [Campylobacteraceae bacterium]
MDIMDIFVDESTLTRFGFKGTNYCGPGYTAGVFDSSGKLATNDGSKHTTSVDEACKDHDDAYGKATNATDILIADLKLMADVAGLYTQGKIESPYDLALSVGIFAAFAVKTVLWDLPNAFIDFVQDAYDLWDLPNAFIDFVQDAYEMIKDAAIGIYDYFSNSSSSENSLGLGFNDESFWGLPDDYYGATNGQTKQITVIALKSENFTNYDELSEILGFDVEQYTSTNINQAYGNHIHGGGLTAATDEEVLYLPLSEESKVDQAIYNFTELSYETVTIEIPIDMNPWGYNYDSFSYMDSYQTPASNPYSYDYWDYIHNNIFSQSMLSMEEDLRWMEEQVRWIELSTMFEYTNTLIENSDDNEHIDDAQTDDDLFASSEDLPNFETVEYIRIDIIEDIVSVVNLKSYLGHDLEEIFELDINAEFRATYVQAEELLYMGDSFYMPADRRSSIIESDTMYFAVSQDTVTISNDNCPSGWDPLVLDLNGNSQISFVELDKSNVFFDLNADGIRKHTAWIDKDDGFIVYDENGNGKIDNINELFGNDTIDGFADLKNRIDSNGDGIIDASDEKFNDLKVWQDKNQDGMSQKDELFTLDELGITEIRTSNTLVDNNEQITRVTNEGTFVKNSEERYMADVIFEYDPYASADRSFETYSDSFLTSNDINRIIQDTNSFAVDNGIDIRNDNDIKNNDAFMQIVMSGWN